MTEPVLYYGSITVVSFLLLLVYLYRWHKHLDVHMTVIFVLIPIVSLAYLMMYTNMDPEASLKALKLIYLGGCYLPWVVTMSVAALCDIRVSRGIRMGTFLLNSLLYGFVLTIGRFPFFYRSLSFVQAGASLIPVKEYGPVHTVYYVILSLYLIADAALLIYTYRKRLQVSRRILFLLFVPIPVSMLGYAINRFTIRQGIEIVPVTYVLAQVVYLFITHRMAVYNVSDMIVESMVDSGETGFITVDFKNRYLGSNETARQILPDLNTLAVDGSVESSETLSATVAEWIADFRADQDPGRHVYYRRTADSAEDERIYSVSVNYLSDGRKSHGYQIFLADDTQNQKYIALLDKYNNDLQKDVAAKTARIIEMHDRLVLGMATMVESRDNSTGGHIRRTSEGVRILVEEMRRGGVTALTDDFCKNIIKAAPMHDLGKIAVDDAVLRKAGPFTAEEREEMKKHAAEGARIVHEILQDTDDDAFRRIAENVAHYHHEKVDGTGYPDGLKGDEIPLEAKIMAIADVYDALVCKRVYKEKYSFERANRIILEGMGTHFDAALQPYYEKARPRLEAYYEAEQQTADIQ